METEDENKVLNFLDLSIKNPGIGKYEFKVHRKNAIKNVQFKPESSHDPKILRGVFIGFVDRALKICDSKFLDEEINFLIENFIENGYERKYLVKIVAERKDKFNSISVESDPYQ